ncbi:hypothetical protein BU17DRAFT_51255 [Hysterangium stoloniferum]|nr:hypothetical protein BU17DRAFT_51255 [Hysterangium stoloniferum]
MFSLHPIWFLALSFFFFPSLVRAQDGSIDGPTTDPSKFPYSCDTNKCKLPTCNCASTNPPGGLSPSDTPMFVVFTADDAIQSYTINAVNNLLAGRKNPNGCPIKMTYYTSITYTNFSLVTDWYVAGNEIADHTITHVGDPQNDEINGNLIALNALAGIPLKSIQGFRAPFLNFSGSMLQRLKNAGFTYDSSASASIPVTDPNTDAYWPYTLDNGLANNCLALPDMCSGRTSIPGLWEVPMYCFFDSKGINGPHLMDPWLDAANGATAANDSATLAYMQSTFMDHYNGKRQPIGLYTHPIHIAIDLPGVTPLSSTITMINKFLDWAQEQPNVWIISTEQLLAWVQNPKPISQLDQVDALKCPTPQVNKNICNGIPSNEAGLLAHCAFTDFPWSTCYGCPTEQVSPANPNPPQQTTGGQALRFRIPANCNTAFWDPIAGSCLCNDSSCQFADNSRPIGPNGANLTSGEDNSAATSATVSYVPFSGNGAVPLFGFDVGLWASLAIGVMGVVAGGAGTLAWRI